MLFRSQQSYGLLANGDVFIHLDHPQQICPEDEGVHTGDYITLHAPGYDMNLSIVPETPGGIGTIAMVVNMIPHVHIIDHQNGFFSLYGFNSDLVVKRGDTIARGQMIARSGMTGSANQPSLHFELRKDGAAINPLPYFEK